jgi:putative nucleotidyltransferase with HDIG domain
MQSTLRTPADALQLLAELGASPWLIRHHELVVEAAQLLAALLADELGVMFDRELVLLGSSLHDAGKVLHPSEMRNPGHEHEPAGRELLLAHGVPDKVARFCVTHADWWSDGLAIEDLLVALADKLWKGKREEVLERRVLTMVAQQLKKEEWAVFSVLDAICERVASDGPVRLARSAERSLARLGSEKLPQ